jgi:hypothetical protein
MRRSCTNISCRERNKKKKKIKYTVLDEITKKEIPKVLENQNVQQQDQHVPKNPASVVRRSTRLCYIPRLNPIVNVNANVLKLVSCFISFWHASSMV